MIYNEIIDDEYEENEENHAKSGIKNKSYIIKVVSILVITLIVSPIMIKTDIYPASYAMLGVASVLNIPLLLASAVVILSMFIFGLPSSSIITFSCVFVVFSLITAMLNINGLSKKYSVLIKLFISLVIVNMVEVLFLGYSFFSSMLLISVVMIVYLIFVHGTSSLLNIRKGYVFTEEEYISAMCVAAFILSTFSNISIYGVRISNIFLIMLVLIYGYRKGALLGCTSGFVLGLIYCILTSANISFAITLAAGGLISGIMNKIGKTATCIGFVIGTVLTAYLTSEFAYYAASIIEITIAAIPVLLVPKKYVKKVEELFNFNGTLSYPYDNLLNSSDSAAEKISTISSVMSLVADSEVVYTKEDKVELRSVLRKYILEYIRETNIENYSNKEKIDNQKLELCTDYIATRLEQGDEITEDMLMLECANKKKLVEDIKDIYSSVKIMRILKRKEEEIHKKCSNEYKEISSIISQIAKTPSNKMPVINNKGVKNIREELKMLGYTIYEDDLIVNNDYVEYTFITDILDNIDRQKIEIASTVSNLLGKSMKIRLLLNISKTEKSKIKLASVTQYVVDTYAVQKQKETQQLNGDSYLSMNFGQNKYISVISDGAGSGEKASASSKLVIETLEKLIKAGLDETKASEIVNRIIKLREDDTSFASLDTVIFNLETADASFIKFGAAPTYIISEGKVTTVNSMNLPVGLVSDAEYIPIVKKLNNDDIVLQISDGVILGENNIHDNYFTNAAGKIDLSLSPKQIAENLLDLAVKNRGINHDDITVVVNKIKASKSIK